MTNKYDQIVLAIPTEVLFAKGVDSFQGFKPHSELDFEKRILEAGTWMRRGDIEEDPTIKHIIPYTAIVNPKIGKVFVYQRAVYDEERLSGKKSFGVGGHIDQTESDNPLNESRDRETHEEITFSNGEIIRYNVIGYINDDSNKVGEVHFGVFSIGETDATLLLPKDSEIYRGQLVNQATLEGICRDQNVENWSRIILDPLKKYLNA